MRINNKLIQAIEKLDWNIEVENDNLALNKKSPFGQDFSIDIDPSENIEKQIYEAYESYDASEEAYRWLGPDGHGINGAPNCMVDVYNDMVWCEKAILKLWLELNKK